MKNLEITQQVGWENVSILTREKSEVYPHKTIIL